jgi:hypothetical protein
VWRRSQPPEPAISHDEVLDIIGALADIKAVTLQILELLKEEEDEGEDDA